jgi:hypothetical protein
MERRSKNAVVRRLEFAVAELEVISQIASLEGDTVMVDQLGSLTEGIRGCIRSVSNGHESDSIQPSACGPFVGIRR